MSGVTTIANPWPDDETSDDGDQVDWSAAAHGDDTAGDFADSLPGELQVDVVDPRATAWLARLTTLQATIDNLTAELQNVRQQYAALIAQTATTDELGAQWQAAVAAQAQAVEAANQERDTALDRAREAARHAAAAGTWVQYLEDRVKFLEGVVRPLVPPAP